MDCRSPVVLYGLMGGGEQKTSKPMDAFLKPQKARRVAKLGQVLTFHRVLSACSHSKINEGLGWHTNNAQVSTQEAILLNEEDFAQLRTLWRLVLRSSKLFTTTF